MRDTLVPNGSLPYSMAIVLGIHQVEGIGVGLVEWDKARGDCSAKNKILKYAGTRMFAFSGNKGKERNKVRYGITCKHSMLLWNCGIGKDGGWNVSTFGGKLRFYPNYFGVALVYGTYLTKRGRQWNGRAPSGFLDQCHKA
ncbi:hypothetical protein GGTG_04681 [Gaeumannomyces tritici R3-111a-1]|uniref:Uncharacterized protein n=1 Tax=Gaeumannomyces tritici (strain R3-111a-1) TaxID=644352 RepID=J3NTT2_GAET3|nr:hypothetical protein GGTG_04681 [Gaeumannomyces tritici R3-111a-1]EJT79597.1 hypothetical protein GGTG_04681 [Gaeumannomyces tritici R3-111a-1]